MTVLTTRLTSVIVDVVDAVAVSVVADAVIVGTAVAEGTSDHEGNVQ